MAWTGQAFFSYLALVVSGFAYSKVCNFTVI